MTVSWRHTFVSSAILAAASVGGLAIAQTNGHVVSVPGVTIGAPTHPTGSTCCAQGQVHGIYPPGVTVPSPNIVVNQATAQVGSQYIVQQGGSSLEGGFIGGADTRTTFISNRSYIPMAEPIMPSTLDLNVAGTTTVQETVTEKVPIRKEVCVEQIVERVAIAPVRASCIDETGTPHPASRNDDTLNVDGSYTGELFRCVAGTTLQVTIGRMVQNEADFSQAGGFSCAKGEALIHKAGGELVCGAQAPRRNCNERSLLRKYGPGLKLVETRVQDKVCQPTIETHYKTVQRDVVREMPLPSSPIMLDGGVGQAVTY